MPTFLSYSKCTRVLSPSGVSKPAKGTSAKYSFKGIIRKPLTHEWADKPWEGFLSRTEIPSLVSCQLKLLAAIIAHESLIQLCLAATLYSACLSHCGFLLLSMKWLLYHLATHCISLKTALEPSISKCLQSCPFFFLSFFFLTSELFLSWTECWMLCLPSCEYATYLITKYCHKLCPLQ